MLEPISFVAVAVIAYIAAVIFANRSAGGGAKPIRIQPGNSSHLPPNVLTISSWNIGYAGLGEESDFVVDGGKHWLPPSRRAVRKNLDGICATLKELNADINFLQEVPRASPLTLGVDCYPEIRKSLPGRSHTYQIDVDLRFVPPPIRLRLGTAVFSRFPISNAEAVPICEEDAFLAGIVRKRYSMHVVRLMTEASVTPWTLINIHLAAFDEAADVRRRQLDDVLKFAVSEYQRGARVVVGGDWNLVLSDTPFPNSTDAKFLFWVHRFDETKIPSGWKLACDPSAPTVRTNYQHYVPGENYTTIIDGFLVSPNVVVRETRTTDLGFKFSDHQPVTIRVEAVSRSQGGSFRIAQ